MISASTTLTPTTDILFKNASFNMHVLPNKEYTYEPRKIHKPDGTFIYHFNHSNFGVLELETKSFPMTKKTQFLLFNIDCSGSMGDICDDNHISKLDLIIHTLKNMIILIKDINDIQVYIQVNAFDNISQTIIEKTLINSFTYESIIDKINKMTPGGMTHIENALKSIAKMEYNEDEEDLTHIFMTDGNITDGNTNAHQLYGMLNINYTHIFIGLGKEHDAILLNTLSEMNKNKYYFIDTIQNTGLVYGEILHNILYKVAYDVCISVDNGSIFNWKSNSWSCYLYLDTLISDSKLIFQIQKQSPKHDLNISITFTNYDHIEKLYTSYTISIPERSPTDLRNYMYRTITQSLLHGVKHMNNKNDINEMKLDLKMLLDEMKTYIKETSQTNNVFMKVLCDDVYITYKTIDTRYKDMYSCSRQCSQGSQYSFNVVDLPDDLFSYNSNSSNSSDNNDNYILSQNLDTEYINDTKLHFMSKI